MVKYVDEPNVQTNTNNNVSVNDDPPRVRRAKYSPWLIVVIVLIILAIIIMVVVITWKPSTSRAIKTIETKIDMIESELPENRST